MKRVELKCAKIMEAILERECVNVLSSQTLSCIDKLKKLNSAKRKVKEYDKNKKILHFFPKLKKKF